MKTMTKIGLIAASALTLSAGAAAAQPMGWYGGQGWRDNHGQWMNINARQAQLDRRIERGLRTGRLTPREAARLRAEFYNIARLENRYRSNGLSPAERADLDRRFDRLAAQIRWEAHDNQYGYGYGYDYRR